MKPFPRRLLSFVMIGLALYGALFTLARRAGSVYKNGAAIICERKREWVRHSLAFDRDQPVVVFMGNSIILSGLIPADFDQAVPGVRSYNLALPTLGIGPAYFLLKSLVRRGTPPAYIVTPVIVDSGREQSLFDYYGIQGADAPDEVLSLVRRPDHTALFNWISPMHVYTHEMAKFAVNSLIHRSDIAETRAKNERILRQVFDDRGYYYIREEAIFPNGTLPPDFEIDPHADLRPVEPPPFDFNLDPYVKKFFDLAVKNHVQVLLIDFIYRDRTIPPFARRPPMIDEIQARYPNVHVTASSWQRKFLPNKFFSDEGHLNPTGAAKFTGMIAGEFNDAFKTLRR